MKKQALRYINIIPASDHEASFSPSLIREATENFTKPALFKGMAPIDPALHTREYFDRIDPEETLQWRRKQGQIPGTMRTPDGKTDYNYVTGTVGTGREFLDDIFVRKMDVYSHLGTISAGYKDPYLWGKQAFQLVKEAIFKDGWFQMPDWQVSGHMFFGYCNQEYGEPSQGAMGSDWHMFPTLNVFVMIAGRKKWMTRPPELLEQLTPGADMFASSSGREAPGQMFDHDSVDVEPGDVLLNMPYEWHKVLNASGLSLGAAFRVIDTAYVAEWAQRRTTRINYPQLAEEIPEDVAHLLTSLRCASLHLNRAQMMLNDAEHVYPLLLRAVKKQKPSGAQQAEGDIAVARVA